VIDLTKLDKVTEDVGDHELYGVIEPDAKLRPGAAGVGKRVTIEDKAGNKLAQFIIGKQVEDRPELYYVRVPGQNQVYKVQVKTDKLSTKFQNWIEEDLLKLNAFDVKEIVMDDHSVDELKQALILRGMTTVDFDSKDSKWSLADMKLFDRETGKWNEVKLADDEELNVQKLNELKTALDDLKIVDVVHKPAGLSADLRAGEDVSKNRETALALQQRGFFLVPTGENTFEIYSNEGEVRCGAADGVEYILRFGGIAGSAHDDDDEKDKEKKEGEEGAETPAKEKGLDRYIMVTTRFRPELIPPPDLQPLPEVPGGVEEPAAAAPADDKPADAAPATTEPDGEKPAETQPAADKPAADAPASEAPKESAAAVSASGPHMTLVAYQPGKAPKQNPPAKAAPKAVDDKQPPADAKPDEVKGDEAKPADAKPDDGDPASDGAAEPMPEAPVDPDAAAAAADKAKREAQAAYKRISEENKRKQDDYDKKVESGKKRVDELNARFADWYYVISDKTYDKIHISREQLIQKKGAKPEGEQDEHEHGLPPGLPPGLIPGAPKQ